MTVADASVLVAWFYPADQHHSRSRTWLRRYLLAGGHIYAPVLLQSEVAGALTRRTGNRGIGERAIRWIRQIPELELVPIDTALGERAAVLAVDLQLRGADAVYVAVADLLQVELVTWDQEQITRSNPRISARQPI